jgi:glycosyltransferase involved in cell wall biosynthesis
MRCPTVKELPPPPEGKTGWPWTEASQQLPDTMPDGRVWPRISIVTPSYSQGQFIEETIRSVLLQGYPNLEYIMIDGGSADSTVEIIKKYEQWLDYWVSERDRGQSHAINKGWERATGEILAWLNSDDWFEPCALSSVASIFPELPNKSAGLMGSCKWWWQADRYQIRCPTTRFDPWVKRNVTRNQQQPSTFLRRSILREVGFLDTRLRFVMDKDLWLRLEFAGYDLTIVPNLLSGFRCHEESKSFKDREYTDLTRAKEYFRIRSKLWGSPFERGFARRVCYTFASLAESYKTKADAVRAKRKGISRHAASIYYYSLAALHDPRLLWRGLLSPSLAGDTPQPQTNARNDRAER